MTDLKYVKPFQDILEEYEFSSVQLRKKVIFYNKLVAKGFKVPSANAYFKYVSISDSIKVREQLELEINRKYVLELVASFEAKIVYYFKINLKRNTKMYKCYKLMVSASVRNGSKHMMFHHLMSVFKEEIMPINNLVYSEFKNLVDYRNWLAHGRSWDLPPHLSKFDFEYAYETIFQLIYRMPGFPESLKK